MNFTRNTNSNLKIENADIRFRNFSGSEGRFNPAGRRNFCVLLNRDDAEDLMKDGWNVKFLQPKSSNDEAVPYIQVTVNMDSDYPPKVILVSSRGKTTLNAETIATLDFCEIENVDLVIRPYNWTVNGKGGIKAYLKTMYVTIREDDFEDKYYDVPDSAYNTMQLNKD